MAPQLQFDERDRKRFLKEAQRASALNHPNIAAIYDVIEDKREILLVMEFVEGQTLRRRMKEPISIPEFLEIAIQCAEGLGVAHEARIVHADIKPENIMLTPAKRVKILDFGVAKKFTNSDPGDVTESLASMTSSISGTPAYMAPEVLKQKPYDGRADLFSLGLTFYEMLGGKQPFQSDSFAGTLAQVLHTEVPPLSDVNRKIPASLAGMVAKMMVKDPEGRYASASAVLEDLHGIQRGETLAVAKLGRRSPGKLRRWAFAGGVVAMLAILLVASRRPLEKFAASFRTRTNSSVPAAALPQKQILAVLPFPVMEGNAKLTSLGQGLVESVSARLSRLTEDRSLEIIPARNLQERKANTLDDARQQIRSNPGLERLAQPIRRPSARDVFAAQCRNRRSAAGGDTLTVPASDAFTVEDDVAQGTVKALQLKLQPDERAALSVHGTDNPPPMLTIFRPVDIFLTS